MRGAVTQDISQAVRWELVGGSDDLGMTAEVSATQE
jgi:hypothetical protein